MPGLDTYSSCRETGPGSINDESLHHPVWKFCWQQYGFQLLKRKKHKPSILQPLFFLVVRFLITKLSLIDLAYMLNRELDRDFIVESAWLEIPTIYFDARQTDSIFRRLMNSSALAIQKLLFCTFKEFEKVAKVNDPRGVHIRPSYSNFHSELRHSGC